MHWILQEFEDAHKLAAALDRLDISYSWHKIVPFVGDLEPEPVIDDPDAIVLFGAYTMWRYAERRGLKPGVFRLKPFVHVAAWQPFLLNGPDARFFMLKDIPTELADDNHDWFWRPVDDSKEEPGQVRSAAEIVQIAEQICSLDEAEIPLGSLRHDTLMMLSEPVTIQKEWRVWIVEGQVRTFSLYKERSRVVYRNEIDDDAHAFATEMADLNPGYSPAYVLDICRTGDGLKILETNCINAAGFYAADLVGLAAAIDGLEAGKG